jgi:peptidoglycan DL-endopeptidase LytE
MMRRRIFLWIGLGVLVASWGLCRDVQARETYRVRQGDTLFGISERFGVTVDALKAANRLPTLAIKPKQVLTIPVSTASPSKSKASPSLRETSYQVRNGDTLAKIAKKTGLSVAALRELNRLKGNSLKIGQTIQLRRAQDRDAATGEVELAKNQLDAELAPEEEEEDGGITNEGSWTVIEQREKEDAALFGHWNSPDEQRLLVKVATGFLGAPYRLGGSSVTGLDCSGFVKKIYQFFNINLPRTAFEQSLVGLRVKRNELVAGDLLFFNTRRALGHVAIYIGNDEFVHASSRKRGVRVDNLSMPYFDKRFVRAVRLKGSDEGL